MLVKFMFGSVTQKKDKFASYIYEEKPIDIFFGRGEESLFKKG